MFITDTIYMTSSNTISLDRIGGRDRGPRGERTAAERSRSGRDARCVGTGFRLHLQAHGQAQEAPPACPEGKPDGTKADAGAGLRPAPRTGGSGIEVMAGRGDGGVRFVSLRMEVRGKGVIGIEIVERGGTAHLRVTVEDDAVRVWIVERCDAIRALLHRSGLSLGRLDVNCRGGRGRDSGAFTRKVEGPVRSGALPPPQPRPARFRGELIG